jgi:hypothetical protein
VEGCSTLSAQTRSVSCVVTMGDVLVDARRAALRRLMEAGCALATEDKEASGSRALWRAAPRYLLKGAACVASTGGSDLLVKD